MVARPCSRPLVDTVDALIATACRTQCCALFCLDSLAMARDAGTNLNVSLLQVAGLRAATFEWTVECEIQHGWCVISRYCWSESKNIEIGPTLESDLCRCTVAPILTFVPRNHVRNSGESQ